MDVGAVAFIHHFGSSLNTHVHFHLCLSYGVFEALQGDPNANSASPPGLVFHPCDAHTGDAPAPHLRREPPCVGRAAGRRKRRGGRCIGTQCSSVFGSVLVKSW